MILEIAMEAVETGMRTEPPFRLFTAGPTKDGICRFSDTLLNAYFALVQKLVSKSKKQPPINMLISLQLCSSEEDSLHFNMPKLKN